MKLSLTVLSVAISFLMAGCSFETKKHDALKKHTSANSTERSLDVWPKITTNITVNKQHEEKIDQIIAAMSIEEKVGQVVQPEIRHVTASDIRSYHIGSVLNGGGSFPQGNKHATLAEWIALADSFYNASMDVSDGKIAIPVMWGSDAVHGHNNVIGATLFPHNIALGATRNPELISQIAEITAKEMSATGIDWNFSPTVAVARDDRWGRSYESWSENPALIQAYAAAYVTGLQGVAGTDKFLKAGQIIGTAKHFIGDGGTLGGIDRGETPDSEAQLFAIHGQGYVGAIEAGVQSVMASFNSWQGERLHGHHYLLTDVLKDRMGFDGFVVGDWNGHEFIKGCTRTDCPQAINAGLDIYMAAEADWKELYQNLVQQVKNGVISQQRIDDAVRRILRVKLRTGLFERGLPSARPYAADASVVGSREHRAVAKQAVRESLVLLKNQHKTLPLSPKQTIWVTGDGADNIGKQSGGWSITWQGTGNTNQDFPGGTSIYDGIAKHVNAAGGKVLLGDRETLSEKPDVAIVVFGEDPYAEMQGDISDVGYRNEQNLQLLKQLKAEGINVVSLFISGRPLWINRELNLSDAFVATWLPGSEGDAVADVIFSDKEGKVQYDFKGKLPFSWPESPAQSPLNIGDEHYHPLFAYDYGLTYQTPETLWQPLAEHDSLQHPKRNTLELYKNRAMTPWHWVLMDGTNRQVNLDGSKATLDSIVVSATDRHAQEDSMRIIWTGEGIGRVALSSDVRSDLTDFAAEQGALVFDIRRDSSSPDTPSLGFYCGQDCGANLSLSAVLDQTVGQWKTLAVELSCFKAQGARFDMTLAPFILSAESAQQWTVNHVRIEKNHAADIRCP